MCEQCFFEYVSTYVKLFFDITFDNGFHDLVLFVPFDTETSNQMHFWYWFFFDFISEFEAIVCSEFVTDWFDTQATFARWNWQQTGNQKCLLQFQLCNRSLFWI